MITTQDKIDILKSMRAETVMEMTTYVNYTDSGYAALSEALTKLLHSKGWTQLHVSRSEATRIAEEFDSYGIDPEPFCKPPFFTNPYLQPLVDNTPELNTENFHMTIEHQTLVNGNNVAYMSVEDFLREIKRVDAEIKRLEDMNVSSRAVTAEIAKLKSTRDELVALLDAHHAEDEAPAE